MSAGPGRAGEVGVAVGGPGAERMGPRQQPLRRDLFPPALDLGEVGGRKAGLAGDLGESAAGRLATLAQDGAEGASHEPGGFAVGENHSFVANHTTGNLSFVSPSPRPSPASRGRGT